MLFLQRCCKAVLTREGVSLIPEALDFGEISISLYPPGRHGPELMRSSPRYAVGVPPTEPLVNFMQHTLKMWEAHKGLELPGKAILVQCVPKAAWLRLHVSSLQQDRATTSSSCGSSSSKLRYATRPWALLPCANSSWHSHQAAPFYVRFHSSQARENPSRADAPGYPDLHAIGSAAAGVESARMSSRMLCLAH